MSPNATTINCSSLNTTDEELYPPAKDIFSVIYAVTIVLGIVGNITSIVVFSQGRRCNTGIKGFLINLAIADLLMTLICLPFSFTSAILEEWVFSKPMCPIILFTQILSVTVSVYTNTAISIDRFVAITYPMKLLARTRRHVIWSILVIWVLSVALCSVQLVVVRVEAKQNSCKNICTEMWPKKGDDAEYYRRLYTVILLVVTYIIPVIFIMTMYGLVCYQLWRRVTPGASDQVRDSRLLKNKRMVVKMLMTMIILFTICWMPLHIFFLITDYKPDWGRSLSRNTLTTIYLTVNWIAMSNSFQNPIIYGLLNDNFRSDLAEMVLKCCPILYNVKAIKQAALANQPLSRLSTKASIVTERTDSRGDMFRNRKRSGSSASRVGNPRMSRDRAQSSDTQDEEITLLKQMSADEQVSHRAGTETNSHYTCTTRFGGLPNSKSPDGTTPANRETTSFNIVAS